MKFVHVLEAVYCDDRSVVTLVECIANLRFREHAHVFQEPRESVLSRNMAKN